MIRAGIFAALAIVIAAPSAANALTITPQRILSDAERCNAHKLRLRSAIFVAEVEIEVVATFDSDEPHEFASGEVTLRPLTVLAGAAKTPLFRYAGSFYAPGVSDTHYVSRGRSIAFIYRDTENLAPQNLHLVPRDRFDADAEICRLLGA